MHAQLYSGLGVGLVNYSGEIGYNDYLVFSPFSVSSRPSIDLIIGTRNRHEIRTEILISYNAFAGDNRYTSVNSLKNYSESKLKGNLFRLGFRLLSSDFGNGYIIGAGLQHYRSYYNSNFILIPRGLQSSKGEIVELIIGKRLKKGRFKDLLELRYSMLFSSNDGFDGVSLGKWNDHLTKLSVCYTIPFKNIKYKYNSSRLIRRSHRHKTQCPSF